MKIDPNEPAFAMPACQNVHSAVHGLTIRAYMATQIMAAFASRDDWGELKDREWAHDAVHAADALIAELNKEQP